MRPTRRFVNNAAVSFGLISLIVLSVAAATDDPLTRISNYKQWTKVLQDLPENTFTASDLAAVGG
ncbi:MAG TPA: hypothetical protein VI306_20120 [Pyrinomonadaceae bacterium]